MTTAGLGLIPTILFVVARAPSLAQSRRHLDPLPAPAVIDGFARTSGCGGPALLISNNQYINISTARAPEAPRRPSSPSSANRLFNMSCRWRRWCLSSSRPSRLSCSTSPASATPCSPSAATSARRRTFSGVPVTLVKVSVYGITGAGFLRSPASSTPASSIWAARTTAPATGTDGDRRRRHRRHEPFRRRRSMVGTVAGAVMLGALANILQLNNINAALQLLATGAIIVLAAVLQSLCPSPRGFGSLGKAT